MLCVHGNTHKYCACTATLTNAVRVRQHPQILCVYGNTHKYCALRQHSQILCVYSNTHNRAYFLGILSLGPLASSNSELWNSPLTFGENFMTISVHRRAGHNYNTRTDTHWIHCSSIPAVQEQIGLKSAQTLWYAHLLSYALFPILPYIHRKSTPSQPPTRHTAVNKTLTRCFCALRPTFTILKWISSFLWHLKLATLT